MRWIDASARSSTYWDPYVVISHMLVKLVACVGNARLNVCVSLALSFRILSILALLGQSAKGSSVALSCMCDCRSHASQFVFSQVGGKQK